MWCKTCNIETNEPVCPICGSKTVEDVPTEVYWCHTCRVPIVNKATQSDKGICPICHGKAQYLAADLRKKGFCWNYYWVRSRMLLQMLLFGLAIAAIMWTEKGNPYRLNYLLEQILNTWLLSWRNIKTIIGQKAFSDSQSFFVLQMKIIYIVS